MTQPAQTLDIRQILEGHLAEVFETMLSLKAVSRPNSQKPKFGDHITGSVGFGGENVTGAVYFHLSADLAQRLAGAMLGLPAQELGETEVNDVIGELTNILAGHLKSCLCDAGTLCAVSTPAIIRGVSYEIESLPEVRRELLVFTCEANPLAVEVHIKFN